MNRLPIIPLKYKWWAVISGCILFSALYLGAGAYGISEAVYLGQSYADTAVPFIGWTIWIYISHYVFLPFVFIVVRIPKYYSCMLYAMLLESFIASFVFVFYPTLIYRQPLVSSDEPEEFARSILYLIDLPTNCFPSLHVALAATGAFFVYKQSRGLGVFTVFWAFLIIISTMTIKQHYFADVVGGLILALVSSILIYKIMEHPAKAG